MLTRGDVLGGRYRLDEPIATGGMGEVWRATDVTLGRTVALKVLRTVLLTDPVFDARFRAEARNLAALSHPNVVNIYDYGRSTVPEGDATYLVMAYVEGQPLSALIPQAGGLPVDTTLSVLAQAADALHAAHAHGIVHRDVKPANLLVRPNGTVVLVDFGVARSPAMSTATTGNQVLGTALYMAPEQASGRGVSPATDIYALGAVGYHCLSGLPPFVGESPIEVALRHVSEPPPPLPQSVPPAVRSLVLRALAKDPADRYPDAAAFAAAARAAARANGRTTLVAVPARPAPATAAAAPPSDPPTLAELPATNPVPATYPVPSAARARPGRGRQWAAALACVLAVGLLVGVVGLLLQTGQRAGGGPAPADRPAPGQPATAGTGTPPTTAPPPPTVTDPASPAPTGNASGLPGAPGAPAPSTTTAKPPASSPPPAPSQPAPTTTGPATSAPPSPPASSVPTADTGATTGPSVAAVPGGSGSGSASGTSSATAPQTRTASGSGSASATGSASTSGSASASTSASTASNSDSPSASSNSPSNPTP